MHVVKSAVFIKSSADAKDCPDCSVPEYAFTGRSNIGKSSLINMLTNRKNLAKASSAPGKTRLINHFLINDSWYLVDLPGYGYAKTSKKERKGFGKLIEQYLKEAANMVCLFLLIDSRHSPQPADVAFIQWLGVNQVPFVIVFTKIDKLSSQQLNKNVSRYREELHKTWETLPKIFYTSSIKRKGAEDILDFIDKTNKTLS